MEGVCRRQGANEFPGPGGQFGLRAPAGDHPDQVLQHVHARAAIAAVHHDREDTIVFEHRAQALQAPHGVREMVQNPAADHHIERLAETLEIVDLEHPELDIGGPDTIELALCDSERRVAQVNAQ